MVWISGWDGGVWWVGIDGGLYWIDVMVVLCFCWVVCDVILCGVGWCVVVEDS